MKKKYLFDSFGFFYKHLQKQLGDEFDFSFSPTPTPNTNHASFFILKNFFFLSKLYASHKIRLFDIIHFNRAEAFFLFKKQPNQISIFEIHGFDVGILGKRYLNDLHNPWKRGIGYAINAFLEPILKKKMLEPDILYVSTPDLVEPIYNWCGRKPLWLPNPMDPELFTPFGKRKKMHGAPICFLASRLHGDKKPEIAIKLFQDVILKKYTSAVLYLIKSGELVKEYEKKFKGHANYEWLPYMDKKELAETMRGSNIIFGDFSIGALSLLPMQAMLCKTPIISLDKYEILSNYSENLKELLLKILTDENFTESFVESNYDYVKNIHFPQPVFKTHLKNLELLMREKGV